MSKYLSKIFIATVLLVTTAEAIELEDIDVGDYYYYVNSSSKSDWVSVVIIGIDYDSRVVRVRDGEKNIFWIDPEALSYDDKQEAQYFSQSPEPIGGFLDSLLTFLIVRLPYHTVDEAIKKMDKANIAFNIPVEMNIEDVKNIRLMLSYKDTIEQLQKEIKGEFSGSIRVSSRMEAKLTGINFDVVKVTPEIQAITKEQNTEWIWEIKPRKEGKNTVYLTISAFISIEKNQIPRMIKTFEKEVDVTVTVTQKTKQFFSNNWQWFWAALLVPLSGWFWNRKFKGVQKTVSKASNK